MNKWLEILLGIVLIIVPIVLVIVIPFFKSWGLAALELIKGGILLLVIFIGLIFLIIGISELKE